MPGMKVMMRKMEATAMPRALMAVCFLSPLCLARTVAEQQV